jgi:hypothetical protein
MMMLPATRVLGRCLAFTCCMACLGAGLGATGFVGWTHAQTAGEAGLSARIDAEFQAVKARTAQVQQELPRLDQALEALAAQLKDRADLSAEAKAAALARVERARAVLRSHSETLQRANTTTGSTDAGRELDNLADLLNMEGDQVVNVVNDSTTRQAGNADQLATAHAAYRKAVTELVDAARKAREAARITREQGSVAGESRSGKGDKQ